MNKENGSAAPAALVPYQPIAPGPYEPASYAQAQQMATDYVNSKLTKCRTKEQTLLVMATGYELGIPATTALRMIYVADFGQGDQITLSADLMVALCQRSPHCEYFEVAESTDRIATYRTKRKGRDERRRSFTIEDKERAKLGVVGAGKDASLTNWAKYPAVMLMHRAAALLAREVYPDVIGGFYTSDELGHVESDRTPVTVRPLSSVPQPPAPVVEAELTEPKPAGGSFAELTERLNAARSQAEGDAVAKEITKAFADKNSPERAKLRTQIAERKAAGWAPVGEPAHDPVTGEVEREPGADDA